MAPATPINRPSEVTNSPRPSTARSSLDEDAPSAARMPISRRRSATEYASTPYIPMAARATATPENVLIISACTRVFAADAVFESVQCADIQYRLARVEIEQGLSNRPLQPTGFPRSPNDQVGEIHRALLVRGIDHRAVVVVEGADLFVGNDTDDLPGNVGASLGLSRDDLRVEDVLTDGVFAREVAIGQPLVHHDGRNGTATVPLIEKAPPAQRQAEG